MFEKSKTVV